MSIKQVKIGDFIEFVGYTEKPEDGAVLLVEGSRYQVEEVDLDDATVVVRVDNPDYNPKRKESETNTPSLLLDVFEEEMQVVEATAKAKPKAAAAAKPAAKGKAAAKPGPEEEEEEQEEQEEPVPATKAKAAAKPAAKAAAKAVDKPAAKAAAKAADKPAAKGKLKVASKTPIDNDNADPYADLSTADEDAGILALIDGAEDILDLARETVEEANAVEYRLGGILFHVRKGGEYTELDNRYKEKGGFGLYVLEELNVEYRKAMYLVDIYYKWNKFGLDADKVAQIGWAKASKIAAVMTEDTADELLELAESTTVAELVENIKTNYKAVGATPGEKKMVKLFKFKLFENSAAAVEEVLDSVAVSMGFQNLDQAFEHIIMEWATEHPMSAPEKTKAKAAPAKAKPGAKQRA